MWIPMLPSDNEVAARNTGAMLDDPRVVQYYDSQRVLGRRLIDDVFPTIREDAEFSLPTGHYLREMLQDSRNTPPSERVLWDIALWYTRGMRWTENIPRPRGFAKQAAFTGEASRDQATGLFWRNDFRSPPVESDWFDEIRAFPTQPPPKVVPETSGASVQDGMDVVEPQAAETEVSALEDGLREMLTDATLIGSWRQTSTDPTTGEPSLSEPKPEKYVISKATKVGGDYWLLSARIQFGDKDVSLPVPVRVLWAGDTPVITVQDAGFPGIGTYSARVVLFGGFYAGTWAAEQNKYGGILAGRIVKTTESGGVESRTDHQAPNP